MDSKLTRYFVEVGLGALRPNNLLFIIGLTSGSKIID